MRIFAKTLTSDKIPLDIQGTATVMEVRGLISTLIRFPENQQRLIFEGCEMRNTRTLKYYDVVENTLLLIIRRGHLFFLSEAFQGVFDSAEELQTHSEDFQRYGESLALQKVVDSVEELQMFIVALQDYEESLDEACYDVPETVE
jgi:hypothetical protein